MSERDYEQLTLFPVDSPASPFPWLESKKVKGMTVTSGRKCSGLSENLSRVGYLVRTYLESCELPGGQFVRTWSVRDTISPYLILKLRLSERRTGGSDVSLWPTAQARDHFPAHTQEYIQKKRALGYGMANLNDAVMWPTPRANDAEKRGMVSDDPRHGLPGAVLWPTPAVRDYKGSNSREHIEKSLNKGKNGHLGQLANMVMWTTPTAGDAKGSSGGNMRSSLRSDVRGQLNPDWVEWLMGFPVGYTNLSESRE